MKLMLIAAASFLITSTAVANSPKDKFQACWLETSASMLDAAMAGVGLRDTTVWNSTVSAVLVRHAKGDVLIDTGFSQNAEAQMNELPEANKAFGLQIVSGAKDRTSILDALETVGEKPERVARILLTHSHYDHMGGATELKAPVYVSSAEAVWMAAQAAHPTITPPSLVAAVKPRLKVVAYNSGPYLGFDKSKDIYGDGAIVVVPLPGHTPGSQGVFLRFGQSRVFLIGDAADVLEAAERGLPKSAPIRSNTDFQPELADLTTRHLADFHRAHPEIALIPAHDRTTYGMVFGNPETCVSDLPTTFRELTCSVR